MALDSNTLTLSANLMHCVPLTLEVHFVFVELEYIVTVDKTKVTEPWLELVW